MYEGTFILGIAGGVLFGAVAAIVRVIADRNSQE